ncbi:MULTISPECIES: ArsR/SmtB family transcription factor [Streptomyces]|uniref:ArsR/SmtB family transcription factor n=1 Tax=Streptomyces lycopersici TaxID=2974589 RepID=UPI0021D37231|nr:winged helix-turn-helix domain-containing protein [Streptomyces sp. NEAU-383]
MLHIDLSGEQVTKIRFALSPMAETSMVLLAATRRPLRSRLSSTTWLVIKEHRLEYLAALCRGRPSYLPSFMAPLPSGYEPDVEDQLHAIATTPARRVADEMSAFFTEGGEFTHRRPVSDKVLLRVHGAGRLSQRDPQSLAQRIADELACFWNQLMTRQWSNIRSHLEAEVSRQADTVVRHGWVAAFPNMHPSLSWREGGLAIDTPCDGRIFWSRSLILLPSVHAHRPGLFADIHKQRDTALTYPAGQMETAPAAADRPLGQVLGRTRLALLKSLGLARTTAELAEMHTLTAGSISYHLTRLHTAGLVHRQRRGRSVYYRRSSQADLLIHGVGD